MLEGKELEKKIGENGNISIDVTKEMKLILSLEIDLIEALKMLALKTNTQVDDSAIKWIESVLRK